MGWIVTSQWYVSSNSWYQWCGLMRWGVAWSALYLVTAILIRLKQPKQGTQRRKLLVQGGRAWHYAATNQISLEAAKAERGKEGRPPEFLEGSLWQLGSELLISTTETKRVCFFKPHSLCYSVTWVLGNEHDYLLRKFLFEEGASNYSYTRRRWSQGRFA